MPLQGTSKRKDTNKENELDRAEEDEEEELPPTRKRTKHQVDCGAHFLHMLKNCSHYWKQTTLQTKRIRTA